jgi:hypothetical protein
MFQGESFVIRGLGMQVGRNQESMSAMVSRAKRVLTGFVELFSSHKLFIIFDDTHKRIAGAFASAGKELGIKTLCCDLGKDRFSRSALEGLLFSVNLKERGPFVFVNLFESRPAETADIDKLINAQTGIDAESDSKKDLRVLHVTFGDTPISIVRKAPKQL